MTTPLAQIDEAAKIKLTRARIALIMKQPFFGTLALRLKLIEDSTLNPPTAAVDGKHIYYHPKWVNDNDQDIVESMVGHEVGHCVFDHMNRREGRAPKKWNMANDYVVNDMLQESGFKLGPDWLYNPAFKGMSSDEIYKLLPDMPDDGKGGSSGGFDGHIAGDRGTADQMADDWKVAAVQAATMAAAQGKLPANMKRFIDEIVHGKTDWRAVLRRFVTERAQEDYSYQRVNRKFASLGIFLPGLYSEAMGEMVAVIDTSGSITQDILREFGGEIKAIKDAMRPSMLRVMYCDADVNHVDEFEQYDDTTFEPHGGGGTDFRPPFAWLRERNLEPKVFVYLTDGYGSFPSEPPPYPVLWLMTTDVQPPWGEVVRIEI